MRAHFKDGLNDGLMLSIEAENNDERLLLRSFFHDAIAYGVCPGGCTMGGDRPGYHEIRIYTANPPEQPRQENEP